MRKIKQTIINDEAKKAEMRAKSKGHAFYIIVPRYDEFGWDDDMKMGDFLRLTQTYVELYVYCKATNQITRWIQEEEK